ncbi:MAG TPA: hypothetical protein VFN10_10385 [Thermoanaerobaculia bacterium]|nr:hypothetical protein [Thermoanaerobaculia bacterium]
MLALIAALSISLDLGALTRHKTVDVPSVTCGIKTVSYRFLGEPGQRFRYDGETFVMPAAGWIELIAERGVSEYQYDNHALPLDVWPRDTFGMRTVPLPKTTH